MVFLQGRRFFLHQVPECVPQSTYRVEAISALRELNGSRPQAYRNGYYDGCGAGYAVAGSPFYKTIDTAEPPSADKRYRIGWEDGFRRCKRNYQHIQRVVNSVLGPP